MALSDKAVEFLTKYQQAPETYETQFLKLVEVEKEYKNKARLDDKASVVYKFRVPMFASNLNKNMHGGSVALLADLCCSITTTSSDRSGRLHPHVIDSQISYHKGSGINELIYVITEIEKASRRFISLKWSIFSENGELLYSGRNLKYYPETEKL